MLKEPIAMKGSLCPICKSQMFLNGPDAESLLSCTNINCDFNDKEGREAYFRFKHRSIIAGDILKNVNTEPPSITTMRKPRLYKD